MTNSQFDDTRKFIKDILRGYQAQNTANYDIIDSELKRINVHLIKLNDSVAKHESQLATNLEMRKFRKRTAIWISLIISIVIGLFALYNHFIT